MDLRELVRELCGSLEREISMAQSRVQLDAPEPVVGCWDRLLLQQIVTNLISNALRYGAGKPIDVVLRADPGWAELKVRDRGIGIAAEDQQRIFEQFERAADNKVSAGLGLGLYISRQIVEAHGGTIGVSSTLGSGSIFSVWLPRTAAHGALG